MRATGAALPLESVPNRLPAIRIFVSEAHGFPNVGKAAGGFRFIAVALPPGRDG